MKETKETPGFVLKSNEAFAERRRNVFDQLAPKQTLSSRNSDERMEIDQTVSTSKHHRQFPMKHFKGKESIFKSPQEPVSMKFVKRMPDFKKNPHKWIKYSLNDVKDEDMSDKSNTKAALSFLNELKHRKRQETNSGITKDDESKPIKFKKTSTSNVMAKDDVKPQFKSSKMVMPEYVVGQKIIKEKKNREIAKSKNKEIKLNHLLEDNDSNEET